MPNGTEAKGAVQGGGGTNPEGVEPLYYYDSPKACERIVRHGWRRHCRSCNETGVPLLPEFLGVEELTAAFGAGAPELEAPLAAIAVKVDAEPAMGVYRPAWLDRHATILRVVPIIPEASRAA